MEIRIGSKWEDVVDIGDPHPITVIAVELNHVCVEYTDEPAGAFLGGYVRRWLPRAMWGVTVRQPVQSEATLVLVCTAMIQEHWPELQKEPLDRSVRQLLLQHRQLSDSLNRAQATIVGLENDLRRMRSK